MENAVVNSDTITLFPNHCIKLNVVEWVVSISLYPCIVAAFGIKDGVLLYTSPAVLNDVEIIHTNGNSANIHTITTKITVITFLPVLFSYLFLLLIQDLEIEECECQRYEEHQHTSRRSLSKIKVFKSCLLYVNGQKFCRP